MFWIPDIVLTVIDLIKFLNLQIESRETLASLTKN